MLVPKLMTFPKEIRKSHDITVDAKVPLLWVFVHSPQF